MSKDLDVWRFHGGRVYDFDSLKAPHVVPVIEALDYESKKPVVIDVGGGSSSVVHSARLPFRRHFITATVDIAIPNIVDYFNPNLKVDIEEIALDQAPMARDALAHFLASHPSPSGQIGADLLVYSEILNYVDFRNVMRWFDTLLKPGGFTVVANLPTRGWSELFSEQGVKSHEELLAFVGADLGHTVLTQQYPWGATDDHEGFMVLATRKTLNITLS